MMNTVSRLPGATTNPSTIVNLQPARRTPRRPGWRKSCTQELEAFPVLLHTMAALGVQPGRRVCKDEITTNKLGPVSPRGVGRKNTFALVRNGITNVAGGSAPVVQCSNLDFTPHSFPSNCPINMAFLNGPVNPLAATDLAKGSNGCKQNIRRAYLWSL